MPTRRQTLSLIIASSTAPLLAKADPSLPELGVNDPIAIALGYQADANLVDTELRSALYKEVRPGFGTCTAIKGKLVAGKGWCNAWVPA